MGKVKRRGGHLTKTFHKKRACEKESISGRLHDEDCNKDVFTKLFDRVKSVVSISVCNGYITLFSCSGIAIARQVNLTRFLTSAGLVKALDGEANRHCFDLRIEVCHEGKKVYMGYLDEHDLDRNFAVVNVESFLDVYVGIFDRVLESPHGEAYLVGRDVSGDLMAMNLELGGETRVSLDDKDLDSKISEAWEGGSVFSCDGEFVGMNLFLVTGRAVFLPWSTICKRLEWYWTSWEKKFGLARTKFYGFGAHAGGKTNSYPEAQTDLLSQEHLDLDSMGYPKLPSTMMGAGMILVNTFEETFGDVCGKSAWRRLSARAASSIGRNVVALASFNGERRFFACMGFFIGWNGSTIILTSASLIRNSGDENKIVENLRIEVLLPSKECRNEKLEHYNLHYNVALVSVQNHRDLRPAKARLSLNMCYEVAAIGRCFKAGALMAVSGKLVSWTGTLDCGVLICSSCKIKKAGIGGPLVTMDGDVLGMNFYDKEIGTPFLSWYDICKILKSFEEKSEAGPSGAPFWKIDKDNSARLNRWPVPMPCWRLTNYEDEEDEVDVDKYSYIDGEKVLLI